jgi:hypothetical protein
LPQDEHSRAVALERLWLQQHTLMSLTLQGHTDNGTSRGWVREVGLLAPVVHSLQNLQSLNFIQLSLTGKPMRDLLMVLPSLTNLTHLGLIDNHLGYHRVAGETAVMPCLGSLTTLQSLKSLDLKGTLLGYEGAGAMRALTSALRSLTTLTLLNLSGSGFNLKNAKWIDGDGAQFRSLSGEGAVVYSGGSGEIRWWLPDGPAVFNPYLQSVTNLPLLRWLDLSDNGLDEPEANVLASCLPSLTSLTFLDLSHNDLGIPGIQVLIPALQCLRLLRSVNLERIRVQERYWRMWDAEWDARFHRDSTSDPTAMIGALEVCLESLTSLVLLNLSNNDLKEDLLLPIKELLQQHCALQSIPKLVSMCSRVVFDHAVAKAVKIYWSDFAKMPTTIV